MSGVWVAVIPDGLQVVVDDGVGQRVEVGAVGTP